LLLRLRHDALTARAGWRRAQLHGLREAQELSKLVGLDAGSESPAREGGGETSKSPEQSENVTENKEPAARGSTHEARRCCPNLGVAPPSWRLQCRLEAGVTAQTRTVLARGVDPRVALRYD
jgi:hypothetical protein